MGPKVGGHLPLLLHSSNEPGELSQCSKRVDSTINIVVVIIIIIIIIIVTNLSSSTAHVGNCRLGHDYADECVHTAEATVESRRRCVFGLICQVHM